jgi:hypothetical protein
LDPGFRRDERREKSLMSFDVYLIPTSQSPTGDGARGSVDRALALCGARRGGPEEADIIGASGQEHEFFGNDGDDASSMFPLRGLNPEICHIIFEVAEATRCFILPVQGEPGFLRTPSNTEAPPAGEDMAVIDIPDPEALLDYLRGGAEAWGDYRDDISR